MLSPIIEVQRKPRYSRKLEISIYITEISIPPKSQQIQADWSQFGKKNNLFKHHHWEPYNYLQYLLLSIINCVAYRRLDAGLTAQFK